MRNTVYKDNFSINNSIFFYSNKMIHSRVTSATVLVEWGTRIHTHAVLVYGKNPSSSKNYEEYAKKITTSAWGLEETVRAFWGKGPPQGHIVMQGTFCLCAFLRIEIGMHKDGTLQYDNK